jgi:spore coat polysaccharide biosynthesis protein SpsF (cytidylyltransferase family)
MQAMMARYGGLTRIASGGYGVLYRVPTHAVKIWKNKDKNSQTNYKEEATMLMYLSTSAHTSEHVPQYITHNAEKCELHIELLDDYQQLDEVMQAYTDTEGELPSTIII